MLSLIETTIAYILGIIWGLYLDEVLVYALIFFMLGIVLFLALSNKFIKVKEKLIKIIILLAISYISFSYTNYKFKKIDNMYEDEQNIKMDVTIITHGKKVGNYSKYYCVNEKNEKFLVYIEDATDINIGTNISIEGKFNKPSTSRNYGGFNYKLYMYSINTYGTIYATKSKINYFVTNNIVYNIQNYVRNTFRKYLNDDYAGILTGMVIGETTDISSELMKKFEIAGIVHLLAVSGSNVSLIISLSSTLFIKFLGQNISSYLSILFTILFIFVAGASPSVMRAGIMAIFGIVANFLFRKSSALNNMAISAIIILIINPISIVNTGFVLSFIATIGIIKLSKALKEPLLKVFKFNFISETLSVTLSAQIMLLPFTMYYFNNISILSLFTNIIIVPITRDAYNACNNDYRIIFNKL